MAGVGEQRERQRVLLAEAGVRGLVVGADPENDGASFPEEGVLVAQLTRLSRAARRGVFGIEVEDDRTGAEAG